MEFPELGSNCSQDNCNQLDFLPVKCDGCKQKFCGQHWKYEAHNCPSSRSKDAQVPVCPLCDQPVPSSRSVVPDIAVSAHIDRDCKSDPAVKKRDRCSFPKCKQKELIKILCDDCGRNFCLKHRHKEDHKCTAASSKPKNNTSKAGLAALQRMQQAPTVQAKRPQERARNHLPPNLSAFQGGLSEDEAFQRALQQSLQDSDGSGVNLSQEEQDRMLAEAIARSERESHAPPPSDSRSDSKSCVLQ